jgi:transcription elongation factor GreA
MPTQLSPEAHARLVAELEDLKLNGRVEIAKRIEAARALGDLSENADYHAAKDDQGKMDLRIRQLEAMLEGVEIVEASTSDGIIRVGSVVTVDFGDGEHETFLIGSIEEQRDDVEIMSPSSPLGEALLGKVVDDKVAYAVRDQTMEVTVTKVE